MLEINNLNCKIRIPLKYTVIIRCFCSYWIFRLTLSWINFRFLVRVFLIVSFFRF